MVGKISVDRVREMTEGLVEGESCESEGGRQDFPLIKERMKGGSEQGKKIK